MLFRNVLDALRITGYEYVQGRQGNGNQIKRIDSGTAQRMHAHTTHSKHAHPTRLLLALHFVAATLMFLTLRAYVLS